MKVTFKKYQLLLMIGFLFLLCYLFWGPLFPWNPVKIGYQEIASSKATVYIKNIQEKDEVLYRLDNIISELEELHDLKYNSSFKIIVLDEDSNMKRYLPWLKGSGYSVSLSFVNVIYIGPAARKSQSGIEWHLKHELSHLLIGQNTTSKNALIIHEQGWLAEGIAEYFSGHSFYNTSEYQQLNHYNSNPPMSLQEKNPHKMSFGELKLKYSHYKFFIGFLVNNYGLKKLQDYLKNYLQNPDDYKNLFIEIYNEDLNTILSKFNKDISAQK